MEDQTIKFHVVDDTDREMKRILTSVYCSLSEKGYNPINQLVGYMISGDPAYITSHKQARNLICKVDRDEIMEVLIKNYLEK